MSARLVDQLLEAGLVTEAQANECPPGDPLAPSSRVLGSLVARGLDERTLAGFFVSRGFGPMLQTPELQRADTALIEKVSAADARELCAMPLRASPAGAVVAMADPTDERAITKLSTLLGGPILPTVAKLSDLLDAIDRAYPSGSATAASDPGGAARPRTPSGVVDLSRPRSAFESTASPVWDRAWSRSTTEPDLGLDGTHAAHVPLPTVAHATPSRAPESDLGPVPDLAAIVDARTRDDAVRLACEACLGTCRAAAFLALRKGVFRGWDGAGEGVTGPSIRSLWVPASNPSMLNEVLHTGKTFLGAYGETAADELFRAAIGTHGSQVVIAPVQVGSRMVGVLCANEPASDSSPIESVATALGQAFERLIVSRKSGA